MGSPALDSPAVAELPSFRRQLFMTIAVGMVTLSVIVSIATAWVTYNRSRDLLLAQGIQITGNLAKQSVLALLYGSAENAQEAVRTTLAFPEVHGVSIYDTHHHPLTVTAAEALSERFLQDGHWPAMGAELVAESKGNWHFVAPVFTRAPEGEGDLPEYVADRPKSELLGHVYVVMGSEALREMQISLFFANTLIAFTFTLVLLLLLKFILERLTRPLMALSGVMLRAEGGDTNARAEPSGPREIARIAEVFNKMMEALALRNRDLRQQTEVLESEVAMRTKDLVYARDAALAASRQKSEFLANITHELRTPLQAVIGYTDLVIEGLEDEGVDEYTADLQRVLHSAQHLMSLITDVLDLAKIEAGRMELKIESVDLEKLLREAAETVQPLVARNHNQLLLNYENGSGQTVEIDRGRVLQIILNLMSNAAKFTEHGSIEVRLMISQVLLVLDVEDNGIGMSDEQQSVIFEQFRQVDGTTTRRFEGTGLGLSITRRLCTLMGGQVGVVSAPGEGSRFSVRIPLPIEVSTEMETGVRSPG